MRTKLAIFVVGASLVAGATGVRVGAHHSFSAEFDADKPVELRGEIIRMEWINPHSWIHIKVKNPDGTVETWMVEGGPPTSLLRRGLTKKSIPVGAEVTVHGYLARNGKNMANGRDIRFADGQTLFLGSSGTGAPLDGRDPTEKR